MTRADLRAGASLPPSGIALETRETRYRETITKPARCTSCGGARLSWKQWRTRSGSLWIEDRVVYDPAVASRRVRCRDCGRSTTVQPRGIAPRKHYQLDVIARAVASYGFDSHQTLEHLASVFRCARRTVSRWVRWVASLAAPAALLQRLAELTLTPIVPRTPAPPRSPRPRHGLAERAAEVLTLFEALGTALGAEPPGLRAVLEQWGVPSYAAPALPNPLPVLAR